VFEPFFTTQERGEGTGLGLATVHGIAARCGGSVNVYSEVGHGSSFKVYFPRADAGKFALDAPAAVPDGPRATGQVVLVVDDAEGIRGLASRLLGKLGYTVLLAANADEALGIFEQNVPVDVLLTDVIMPGTSGPELTRRLLEHDPALKVIYMSGYPEDAIGHHGILDPGTAFLHKPFTDDALGRKLREVLGARPISSAV
jgi:CheY-like chemotaxis protein